MRKMDWFEYTIIVLRKIASKVVASKEKFINFILVIRRHMESKLYYRNQKIQICKI